MISLTPLLSVCIRVYVYMHWEHIVELQVQSCSQVVKEGVICASKVLTER